MLYLVQPAAGAGACPTAELLDEISYRAIVIGFPFLTLTIVLGAVWADIAWGRYWSWDPKETASLVTWLIYGAYLHARVARGWRGQRAALLLMLVLRGDALHLLRQPLLRRAAQLWLADGLSAAGGWTLLVMVVTAIVILAVTYLADRPAAGGSFTSVVLSGGASGPAPEVGQSGPGIHRDDDRRREGHAARAARPSGLADLRSPWCQPCRAENPDIEATYEKYQGQGLKLLAIFVQDNRSDIQEYTRRTGLTYPKVDNSNGRIASSYRIAGIPSHFFIDSSGILREIRISSLDPSTMGEDLAQIGVNVAGSTG